LRIVFTFRSDRGKSKLSQFSNPYKYFLYYAKFPQLFFAPEFITLRSELFDDTMERQKMTLIRSISGIRGIIGDGLTPDIIIKYAAAFSQIRPKGKIVIGRDGRPSGKWIENMLSGALAACGRDVEILGIAPTPTVQLATERSNAGGGIVITASHNPREYNGLKFLAPDGVFLDGAENLNLFKIFDSGVFDYANVDNIGSIRFADSPERMHIENILGLEIFKSGEIREKLRSRKLKVVVDAVNAAGSRYVPALLGELGCETIELFCDESGEFPHTPEPVPDNLGQLRKAVQNHKADLGVAVDPDADRLVLIDENGLPVGEEKTIVIAADAALSYINKKDAAVAVNYSTTRMVEDMAGKHGARVFRSPVGEINVVRKMKDCGAVIGGEGSGGVILSESHYGRDSLVGTALVLAFIAMQNKSLSQIAGSYPEYFMIKQKQAFSGEIEPLIARVKNALADGEATVDDGIKINYDDGWVQLRASNTEPIVRIMAESPSQQRSQELLERVTKETEKHSSIIN
jgi:phosphomannomutase